MVAKMCGEKEVLAQIKLSFQSINKSKLVCTRSMQLTVQSSGKRVQKTLDGQLLVVKNGERHTISSKCAELDMVMPQYLGVSKAVLEYVIFCHQDDSLWPMSEPATLKKRFDEIFEAMKYTKAVENLKNLKKKQMNELGKLRILLDQYRTDKDRGERAKRRSDELHEEIEDMRAQVDKLSTDMREVAEEQKRLFNTAKGFERTIATLAMKRQEANSRSQFIKDQSQHMTHLEESDEELERMQAAFRERMETYNEAIEDRRRKHREAEANLEAERGRLNAKLTEQGRIEAERTVCAIIHESGLSLIGSGL
jgi:DNA repair protein RAD50